MRRFAYVHSECDQLRLLAQGATMYKLCIIYCANTNGATSLLPRHLFFQNSPNDWAVLTENGNMTNIRYYDNSELKRKNILQRHSLRPIA